MTNIIHTGKRGQPARTAISTPSGADPGPFLLTSAPPAPTYFNEEATTIWFEIAAVMLDRAGLTIGDLAALEIYAHNLALFRHCNRTLDRDGYTTQAANGRLSAHPLCVVRKGAELQLTTLAATMGLSPKARRELKTAETAPGHTDRIGGF